MAAVVAPRVAGDAEHDLEEPGAGAVAAVDELGEAPVGDDEDLLRPVLGVGFGHPKPPQVAPDEIDVRVVHGPERAFATFALGPYGHGHRLQRRARCRGRGDDRLGRGHEMQMAGKGRHHHLTFHENASSSRPDQSGW